MSEEESGAQTKLDEFIAFCVQEEEYCIEITTVREIRRWTSATRLPRAPEFVIGVINLRGAVVPVIDFAARLGKGLTETTERHTIIIVEWAGQTFGLLVDSVSDILTAGEKDMQPTPAIASEAVQQVVSTLIIVEDRMLRIVNVGNIVDIAAAATALVPDAATAA
ncbi:MAG: chemotaxis protein CheW [Pseudomonadota bacterium]